MPNYRRAIVPGGTFFFTVVTAHRRPLLTRPDVRRLLRRCIIDARRRRPFDIGAAVLLPDHLHMIWTLPEDDSDFSVRWSDIKANFTMAFGQRIWQPRFHEHAIRDTTDLHRYLDYIHYNPVKHALVTAPRDWPWSSFHRYVAAGAYEPDWADDPALDLD